MLINKKISFLKYYKETSLDISSLRERVQTVYRLQNNYFYIWNKLSFSLGENQDFYFLEKDNSYIIISDLNLELGSESYEIDTGESDEDYEFIVNDKQICLYKGNILDLDVFKTNILSIYKISPTGDSYLIWNSFSYDLGEIQDFSSLLNNELYFIVSKNTSYVFWPPFNFNKSQSINTNNVNWGLLEHIR
jgi:hypothetical protein